MFPEILPVMVLSLIMVTPCFSQEKSKKQLKKENITEREKQIEAMINAKEFVFTGNLAIPQTGKSVDLTQRPNYVRFHPDLIESSMPFFGEAFTSPGYGSDTGLKFEGKPDKFTVTKARRNYQINLEVKAGGDYFNLSLSIGFGGNATLIISSANRRTITYFGEISAPEKSKQQS